MHIRPAQLIAFLRLGIDRLAVPLVDMHKEIHPLIVLDAVHHTGEECPGCLDPDADLFLRFTPGRAHHTLVPIQVPGRDAVFAVPVACVETAQQQDAVLAEEE